MFSQYRLNNLNYVPYDVMAKKPVASTVVAMRFKQFVGMSSGLANMTKFKNI